MSSSGKIANWEIRGDGLYNDQGTAYIIGRELLNGGKTIEARIGANILPGTSGLRALGYFVNEEVNPSSVNLGVLIGVSGGQKNIALNIMTGDMVLNPGARLVVQENMNVDLPGITVTKQISVGGFLETFKWVNGLLVSSEREF